MAHDIDAEALVAHLTNTTRDRWERAERGDDPIHLVEDHDDLGPSEDTVAEMVREGFTSGERWSLDTKIDLGEDDAACQVIADLIANGFTSGYDPTWSVKIDNREPRVALVEVDDDGDVTATIGTDISDNHQVRFSSYELVEFSSTVEDMLKDPDLAGFVRQQAPEVSTAPSP